MENNALQRDEIIKKIINLSLDYVKFISPDFGAQPLDEFRQKNPNSFVYPGIAEQLSVDIAYGISLGDNLPIIYGMSPFISSRCFEQYKVLFGQSDLPICVMPVGCGLGYDHNTLSHYSLEDIALFSSVPGLKIYTPYDCVSAKEILLDWIETKDQIVIRLERQPMPIEISSCLNEEINKNKFGFLTKRASKKLIISWGFLGVKILQKSIKSNCDIFLFNNFAVDNVDELIDLIKEYESVIITEESFVNTGLASILLPALINLNCKIELRHIDSSIYKIRSHRNTLWEKYNLFSNLFN